MDSTVLVFGAYGALGRGVLSTLLKKDYKRYYLFDFNAEKNTAADGRVINVNVNNLADEKNVGEVFSRVPKDPDTKFFLFSTIGGFWAGAKLGDTKSEDWDKMFSINLKTNFLIARNFIHLAEKNGGAACFTSALSGYNPEPERIAYGTSKSALIHMIRSLSEEYASEGISFMGIAPHILDTPANREWVKKEDYHTLQKPAEIGELVDFLFRNYFYLSGNVISLKTRFGR